MGLSCAQSNIDYRIKQIYSSDNLPGEMQAVLGTPLREPSAGHEIARTRSG